MSEEAREGHATAGEAAGAVTSDFTTRANQFLLAALGLFVLAVFAFPLREPDAFAGLAAGLEILRRGIAVGGEDWFHDLVMALVYRGNGPAGLVVLRVVGVFLYAIMAFGFLLARGVRPFLGAMLLAISLLCAATELSCGPVLSGMLFSGGLFFMLARGPRRGILWVLPLYFVIWANVAGSSVLPGLAGAAAYSLILAVQAFVVWDDETRERHRKALVHQVSALLLASVAVLIQPATTEIYRWSPGDGRRLPLMLVLVVLAVILGRRPVVSHGIPRRSTHLFCVGLMALVAGYFGGSWLVVFSAAFPFLVAPLAAEHFREMRYRSGHAWATAALLLLISIGVVLWPARRPGLDIDAAGYPKEAVERIFQERLPAPVGAEPGVDGYVAFRMAAASREFTRDPRQARTWIGTAIPAAGEGWQPAADAGEFTLWVRPEAD